MKKNFGYVIFAIITIFLVFSNVVYKDKKCYENKNKQFVVVGGKHYFCSDNKVKGGIYD